MSSILDKIANISFYNIVSRIFLILVIMNLAIGTDLVMTGTGIANEPILSLVPEAQWYVIDSDILRFDISLNFPNEGFIPKGAQINMQIFISHSQSSVINDKLVKNQLVLGESLEFEIIMGLTSSLASLFVNTGLLNYQLIIQIIPEYLGLTVDSALRTLSIYGNVAFNPSIHPDAN